MKNIISSLMIILTTSIFAQNGINYKAIVKDNLGSVLVNEDVTVQFNILKGFSQTNVYSETHNTSTDDNGIIIVDVGEGAVNSGSSPFSSIEWASDKHYLEVLIDIGNGLINMGTTRFKTVPYAIASGDKSWDVEPNNVHVLSKNVGIGTSTPTELLEISDGSNVNVKLTVPSTSNSTNLVLANGNIAGFHSFYKIENRSDQLRFQVDTDFNSSTGYENKMTLSNNGLAMENGTRINEFSTDGNFSSNSNDAVPTEKAIKTYVDNRNQSNYWRLSPISTNTITNATSTPTPVGPALIINKEHADSNIEVTVNTRLLRSSITTGDVSGVLIEIRIDNNTSIISNRGSLQGSTTSDFVSMFAVFENLSIGSHTVQIYARVGGTGTTNFIRLDSGNFGGAIIAKETF